MEQEHASQQVLQCGLVSELQQATTKSLRLSIFTNSALWLGLIIELQCPFVCMCVTKVVIVDNGQFIRVFVFCNPIELACRIQTSLQKCKKKVSKRQDFIRLVPVSAHAKRVGVSRTQYIFSGLELRLFLALTCCMAQQCYRALQY